MSSLLKTTLHNSIADGLFNEIQNRSARYYYFLGKTLSWDDEQAAPLPVDSIYYENSTRNEIITMKEIKSTDVAYVVPRVDWVSGQIWDMYDDQYSTEVQGINLISGGFGYSDPPTITISGGGGSGATASAEITDGVITNIILDSRGSGYTTPPIVAITGGGGEGGSATAVITKAYSGTQRIEDTNSYVITDEYNVYKCLDNNNNAISTYKPIGTVVDPVVMPDGYMWKYLYSIPIALRNKFLTDQYMPVINALRSQFYSGGQLINVVIQNGGTGYTFGNITVSGDGYRESDPLLIQNIQISAGGSGYTAGATVTIESPFPTANAFQPSTTVLLGQKIEYNNNLYQCSRTGVTSSVGPSHKIGIVENGSASFLYIGTRATGTVNITSGVVSSISLNGMIYEINLTDGGSGYTTAPTVTLTGGGGSNFVGSSMLRGTSVAKVHISDAGLNYTSVPTVKFGTQWTASTALTVGQQVYHNTNLYTVLTAGTTGTTGPTHQTSSTVSAGSFVSGFKYTITALGTTSWNSIGYVGTPVVGGTFIATGVGSGTGTATTTTATNGTTKLDYVGRPATGTAVLKYGAGYSGAPNVSISPVSGGAGATGYAVTSKSEAKLIPLIDSGQIVGVQIDDGGIGYTYANLSVTGDGTLAELTADLSPGDIDTLQANTELLTPDGRIMSCPVISGGFGYGGAPTVTITGDGTGAAATATVENGSITKINMVNYGQGYRWAKVSITAAGSGYGASARAAITPYGGHGKDPINGMYARTLMFYSNISKDQNQGFDVNNDFRQIGIIKNPRQFGQNSLLKSALASACYVVTGTIDTTVFTADTTLTMGSLTGPRFRIVSVTSTGALLQSLDNAIPTVGATFLNSNSVGFGASGVTAPTADKYSGDLMFIDNKQAFTPTVDQTVTMRTVIKF